MKISLLSAIAAMIVVLAGCGGGREMSTQPSGPGGKATPSPSPAGTPGVKTN